LILTINDCNTESNRAKQNQEQITTSISQILKDSKLNTPDNENYLSFIENISQQINNYHQNTKKHIEIKGQKDGLSIELANTKKQISEEQLLKEKIENELIKINQAVDLVKTQRTKLLPLNFSTETKRKALQTQLSEAKTAFDNASVKHNNLLQEKASLQNSINQLGKEIQSNTESQKLLENELNQAITNTSFHTIEEISSALLSHDNEVIAKEIKARIEAQKIKLDTLKEQLEENRVNLDQIKPMDTSFEKAKEAYLLFETTKSKILKRQGEISKQFELDNQIIARNKGVYNEMLEQKDMVNKWTTLMNVLGGSKHAFNTYVQRLTLQQLIQLANKHLFNLNKRYSLKLDEKYKKGEELSFKLVDHYQTDQLRYVDTSSGGEKFLISLSLALGLSDLASNNVNIDSLFIDEGFGTLDSKTLDIVISSLETLQAQGKMIGIISHVENLKERIPTQIQVIKKSNGVSRIEIV
jgi:exonuclease SbcC